MEHCHDHACHCGHHEGEENEYIAEGGANRYEAALSRYEAAVDEGEWHHKVEHILAETSLGSDAREEALKILPLMDVTSLRVTDTPEDILRLVEEVNQKAQNPLLPPPAAVCVYPNFVKLVSESLESESTQVAAVAGGFPSAQMLPEVKTVEVGMALNDGATEIDTVLPVGLLLSGDLEGLSDELCEMKEQCGEERKLKVILETGALPSLQMVRRAALAAMHCGADFIKTSTGKISQGADPVAFAVMCQAVKDYYEQTGRKVGLKAAGGIRSLADALPYPSLVRAILGKEWLTPELLRIGASSLWRDLVKEVTGEE